MSLDADDIALQWLPLGIWTPHVARPAFSSNSPSGGRAPATSVHGSGRLAKGLLGRVVAKLEMRPV